jgi:hypothetical protein
MVQSTIFMLPTDWVMIFNLTTFIPPTVWVSIVILNDSNDRYHGKQPPKDRPTTGEGKGAKHNIYATNRLSDNLQLDNIYSTNSLSLDSDLNDQKQVLNLCFYFLFWNK